MSQNNGLLLVAPKAVHRCRKPPSCMKDLLSYGSSVSIVQMDRQCEFVITIAVTFAIVITKEYHLLPFAMLQSAEHAYE